MSNGNTATTSSVLDDLMGDTSPKLTIEQVRSMVGSGDIDLDDYKGAYRDEYETDPTLTDEALMMLIAEYDEGDDHTNVVLQMKAIEDQGDDTATGDEPDATAATEKVHVATSGLAAKLLADTAFIASTDAILNAREITARGPVETLLHLERLFDDGDWAMVPAPGSKKGETGNQPFDLEDAKEGNRKVVISWFKGLVQDVNPKLFEDLADIKETFKPLGERTINTPQRKEWEKLPILKRMGIEGRIGQRINAYRVLLEKAVKVRMIMAQLATIVNAEGHKMIGCDFDWADRKAKVLSDTVSPIHLFDNTVTVLTEKVAEPMTVGTFLKLWKKVEGIAKRQTADYTPTFQDVLGILRRDKEAVKAAKLAAKFKIENASEALTSNFVFASWIDNKDNKNTFFKLLGSMKRDRPAPGVMSEYEETCHGIYEAMLKTEELKSIVRPIWENVEKDNLKYQADMTETEKAAIANAPKAKAA